MRRAAAPTCSIVVRTLVAADLLDQRAALCTGPALSRPPKVGASLTDAVLHRPVPPCRHRLSRWSWSRCSTLPALVRFADMGRFCSCLFAQLAPNFTLPLAVASGARCSSPRCAQIAWVPALTGRAALCLPACRSVLRHAARSAGEPWALCTWALVCLLVNLATLFWAGASLPGAAALLGSPCMALPLRLAIATGPEAEPSLAAPARGRMACMHTCPHL